MELDTFSTKIIIHDIYITKSYNKNCKEFQTEVAMLSLMNHLNIISIEWISDPFGIVMAYHGQNLSDWLEYVDVNVDVNVNVNVGVSVDRSKIKFNYLEQIALGLEYIHSNNILHLDLKLDNIVVNDNHQIKIIDFGSAEYMTNGIAYSNKIKCTVTHRPPEGFIGSNNLTTKSDIWSFGIIIYELLSGVPIYLQKIIPAYSNSTEDYFAYERKIYLTIISNLFKQKLNKIVPLDLISSINFDPDHRPPISVLRKNLSNHFSQV